MKSVTKTAGLLNLFRFASGDNALTFRAGLLPYESGQPERLTGVRINGT